MRWGRGCRNAQGAAGADVTGELSGLCALLLHGVRDQMQVVRLSSKHVTCQASHWLTFHSKWEYSESYSEETGVLLVA